MEVNGEAKELILPTGITANVAMSDKAITFQFGESDSVKIRVNEVLQGKGLSNSLLRSGMDLSAYFNMIGPMLAKADKKSPENTNAADLVKMIKMLEKLEMKFAYDVGFEDKGVAITFKMSTNKAEK